GIEHDDVEEGRATRGEATSQLDRVAGLAGDRVEVALLEPHGPPVEDVDRRKKLKACLHHVTMLTRWQRRSLDIGRRRNTETSSRRWPRCGRRTRRSGSSGTCARARSWTRWRTGGRW